MNLLTLLDEMNKNRHGTWELPVSHEEFDDYVHRISTEHEKLSKALRVALDRFEQVAHDENGNYIRTVFTQTEKEIEAILKGE